MCLCEGLRCEWTEARRLCLVVADTRSDTKAKTGAVGYRAVLAGLGRACCTLPPRTAPQRVLLPRTWPAKNNFNIHYPDFPP